MIYSWTYWKGSCKNWPNVSYWLFYSFIVYEHFRSVSIFTKSLGYKYAHLSADITGMASLNANSCLLNAGMALLSGVVLSANSKSFMYLSHTTLSSFTSNFISFISFHSNPYFCKSIIPLKIFCFVVNSCFTSRKYLKFVYSVISNTSSYFLCFFVYSSKLLNFSYISFSSFADFPNSLSFFVNF